ncbi:MAG TPA: hypothetical protein VNA11_04200 [Pseudonocardia sp.]|nr:hypothetical protein [Pseudonocardia sp.]
MSMRRRDLLRLTGVVPAATLVSWLAACDGEPTRTEEVGSGPRDLLLVRTTGGLALVDANLGRVVVGPRAGVTTWGGTSYAVGEAGAGRTTVEIARTSRSQLYRAEVGGVWQPRVISPEADMVALADVSRESASPYLPHGRATTTIVVVGPQGERGRFELAGCLEPEAFSAMGDYLYLLDYLPPEAPDHYRVRMLNLGTGVVEHLLTRDKTVVPSGAEEEMRGEGRQAVYVPSQRFLFTLYTHQPDHQHTRDLLGARSDAPDVHAFVHSLNLEQSFAYCIDLPAPFGENPAEGHVIAVDRNRVDPIVLDTTSGALAELDGVGLTVRGVSALPPMTQAGPASAVLNGLLYLGRGTAVRVVLLEAKQVLHEFAVPAPVRGIGVSPNRQRLWVGQPDKVVALDAESGAALATVPVPGLLGLDQVIAKS